MNNPADNIYDELYGDNNHDFPTVPTTTPIIMPTVPSMPILPPPVKTSTAESIELENRWRKEYQTILYKLYLNFNASLCSKNQEYIKLNNQLKQAYEHLRTLEKNIGGTRRKKSVYKKKQSMRKTNHNRKKSNKTKN
jgi:hypothetical protein